MKGKKRKLFLFLSLVLLILAIPVGIAAGSGSDQPKLGWGRVCGTSGLGLRVRAGPGVGYQKVGCLPEGTQVSLWEYRSGWYRVSGPSSDTWVSATYICRKFAQPISLQSPISLQPAVGRWVYFPTTQVGRYNPDPYYRACCDFDQPNMWSAGTWGKIIGGPTYGRWRVIKEGATCHWLWCNRSQIRWFTPSQFQVIR